MGKERPESVAATARQILDRDGVDYRGDPVTAAIAMLNRKSTEILADETGPSRPRNARQPRASRDFPA